MAWSPTSECEREYPGLMGFLTGRYINEGEIAAGRTENCNGYELPPLTHKKPCSIYLKEKNGSSKFLACAFELAPQKAENPVYKGALITPEAAGITDPKKKYLLLTYDIEIKTRTDPYLDIPFP